MTQDDIYIEAFVKMNKFDTYLEIILINKTANMFKNICLSFFIIGDSSSLNSNQLSSLDSVDNIILREHESMSVHKTLKVTPKDASVISANLSYECGNVGPLHAGSLQLRHLRNPPRPPRTHKAS